MLTEDLAPVQPRSHPIDTAPLPTSNARMRIDRRRRGHRARVPALAGLTLLWAITGCQETEGPAVTYPPNTLPVHFERATQHTTCLVASVAMASNYLLDKRRFTESSIREALYKAQRDETRVEDLKLFLQENGLYLLTLAGRLDGKPPISLRYWLVQRGYPVICVINRQGDDPAANHAVVVTGIQATPGDPTADKIVYLDPSLSNPLHTSDAVEFDVLWQRGQRAMMIVVAPPASAPADSGSKEKP